MKKTTKLFAGILISTMLMFAGCVSNSTPTSSSSAPQASSSQPTSSEDTVITVSPVSESIDIKDEALASYDFTKLFTITQDGEAVTVETSMIDMSSLSLTPGSYTVTCTYGGVSGEIQVNVIQTVYEVVLSLSEITMNKTLCESYNFLALFSAFKDGESVAITEDMVTTNLVAEEGTYTYTVTYQGISKTLTIHLTNEHDILVVNTYPEMEIFESEAAGFDYTKLFSLYVNGTQERVTADMIDTSALANAAAGNRYAVVFSYTKDSTKAEKTVYVNVKEEDALVINSKNVVTAPNSEFIDLTELFEIKRGDTVIPVTDDMITGSIDYSKVGTNTITLTYAGQSKTATVEVKRGVIIEYKVAEKISIKKGTDMDSYVFANDFVLYINGIEFTGIDAFIDASEVDFSTVGTYTATISIPYNENKIGLSGVKFTYVEASITYEVVENNYEISVKNDKVTLPSDTKKYNVYNNISLSINGKNQSFTENKNYVDVITCYAELLSAPIDFTSVAEQEVRIAVYVNGVDNEPVIVSYSLQIESTVAVNAINKVIYEGETLFTTGLFTITEDGKEVTPTHEMITGKVDVFTPGVYTATLNYKGVKATAQVIVLSSSIKGVYRTGLETISETSNDSDEDYGFNDSTKPRLLGNFVIYADGRITVDGKEATLLDALDENTLVIKVRSYEYTVYIKDGIAVLEPENDIRLPYNNDKRPIIYFHQNLWTLGDRVTVNYNSTYVLNATYYNYSFDVFKITSKTTQESLWYGLKVCLAEKTSMDTIYTVEWGEVEFAEDFEQKAGITSSLTFDGITYKFTMNSASLGIIKADAVDKKYVNTTFTGMVNGQTAQLRADQYEGFALYIGTEEIFKVGSLEISEMKNGGVNYAEDSVFLYEYDEQFFAYKFLLDTENKTFTVVEGDGLLGLYETDGMYIFLDGYGTGVVNFNTKSYYETQFAYALYSQKLELRFLNTKPSFEYGSGATLFLDAFMNTLTAASFEKESLNGTKLVNSHISRGAVVNVKSYKVGAASDTIAKAQLYENIEIITKDGAISDTAKKTYIDTTRIRFNTPGFYQMTITVDSVVSYYAIQVLKAVYENDPLVATWGAGVIFPNNSLLLDKYGQVSAVIDGITYSGNAKIVGSSFTATAKAAGKSITLTGTKLANGLIFVKCIGSAVFNDYFTTGTFTQSGTDGFMLRSFTLGSETVYLYSKSATSVGEIVSVESESGAALAVGSIFKVTTGDGSEIYGKLLNFTSATNGVALADVYRGAYAIENGELFIDGFGGATLGGVKGTYEMSGRVAFLTIAGEYSVYRLDPTTYTAKKEDVALNNNLLNGKTYKGVHYYMCNDYMYDAETTFIFGENGVVTVKSISSSHDSGDEMCSLDSYAPTFASKEGVKGTYSVKGNQVTVSVGGETFVFKIMNVVTVTQLSCISGTVENNEHGQIQAGVVFEKI